MAIHPSGIGRSSDVGDVKLMYTVIHKKTWQYICDHNSGKTRLIFITFALL